MSTLICYGCDRVIEHIEDGIVICTQAPVNNIQDFTYSYDDFRIVHNKAFCKSETHKYTNFPDNHRVLSWPLTQFMIGGKWDFSYFLEKRLDDYGCLIDYDLWINHYSVYALIQLINKGQLTSDTSLSKGRERRKQYNGTSGYVYLVQSPTGAYKIGRTVNPKNRLKTFEVKLPFEVEYVAVIQTDNMYDLESRLHNKFRDKRVNGEWFTLSPEDVEYIKGLAS